MRKLIAALAIILSITSASYSAEITKGKIGEQDFNRYSGTDTTFNRTTSTGGTITLNRIGHEVDVLISYGNGDQYTSAAISSAIGSIGTVTKCDLVLRPGTWTITGSLTIPSNFRLVVPAGALLKKGTSGAIVFNGLLGCGEYQIFSGFYPSDITGLSTARPEWWGAAGNANITTRTGTDDTTAVQCAVSSLTGGGVLQISKFYAIEGTTTGAFKNGIKTTVNNVIVEGIGAKVCGFVLTSATTPGFIFRDNDEAQCIGWEWKNLGFYGNPDFSLRNAASATSSAIRLYYYDNIKIHDCEFYDFSIGGFYGGLGENISTNVWFERNLVKVQDTANTPYLGFGVVHARGVWCRGNTFDNCALAVSLEVVASGSTYPICSFHINNNTIKNVMDSGVDATDAGIGIQLQATANYIYDGEISGNVVEDVTEQAASSSGSPAGIALIGDSSHTGADSHIYNVTVNGNTIGTVTSDASSPTVYGLYFAYCKGLAVGFNTVKGSAGSGGYGMRVLETSSSVFGFNIIRGSSWTLSLNEYATIECNNTFAFNQCTDSSAVFSSLTTSKSLVMQNQPASSLMAWNLDVFSARIGEGGTFTLGASNANFDTTLYRSAANVLKTDDNFSAAVAEYADNAAAVAAGLTAGQMYRTGDALKIVH